MPIEGVSFSGPSLNEINRIQAANNQQANRVRVSGTIESLNLPQPVGEPRRNSTTPTTSQEQAQAGILSKGQSIPSAGLTGLTPILPGDKNMYKSLLHYILIKKIQTAAVEQALTAISTQIVPISGLEKYVATSAIPEAFNNCYLYELGVTRRDEEGNVLNGDGVEGGPSEKFFSYIRMGLFIEILNNVVLRDRTVPIFSFNTAGDSSTFDLDFYTGNRFATHKDHVSIDPGVCLLPRNDHFVTGETGNRVYDIYLNVDFLIRALDNLVLDNPEVDLITYLETILRNIERVTGNFNDYQVQFYEESYSFVVVDRKYLKRVAFADIPEINIIGVGSVVKNFNLTSLLSPQISNMVAMSAQVGGVDLGLEATAFKKLNKGLRDSVVRTRAVGNLSKEPSEADIAERNNLIISRLNEYLDLLYVEGLYVIDDIENIIPDYITYSKTILGEEDRPEYSFILPFELTLVLEGIGGFRIMESFRVNPQVLPKMYLEKNAQRVAFIVTGVEQQVTKANWNTVIKAQMYMLPSGKIAGDDTANVLASRIGQQKRRAGNRKQGNTNSLSGRYVTSADNNPYNIRPLGSAVNFNGVVGQKEGFRGDTSIGYFLVFDNLQNGVRAGMKNLVNGYFQRNVNTVSKIINKYAPSKDGNNTSTYINTVVRSMKNGLAGTAYAELTADTVLSFKGAEETNSDNIKMFRELNKAILTQEGGRFAVATVDSFNMANLR